METSIGSVANKMHRTFALGANPEGRCSHQPWSQVAPSFKASDTKEWPTPTAARDNSSQSPSRPAQGHNAASASETGGTASETETHANNGVAKSSGPKLDFENLIDF